MTGAPLSARIWRGTNAFGDVLRHHFAVALIAASLAWRRVRDDWRCRLLAGVFAGQCAYSMLVGGDAWEFFQYANRFVAVATPALFVLAGLGVSRALGSDADVGGDLARGALAVGVLVLLFGTAEFGVEPPLIGSFSLFRLCTGGGLIVLAILALGFKRRMHRWRAALQPAIERRPMMSATALALLVCVSLNSHAVARWTLHNAYQVDEDARMSKLGFQLGAGARDDASIAVVLVGAVPYFSNRPAVDILGKNDVTIANMRTGSEIYPGHDKMDMSYSVCRLRPDAIVFWGGNPDLATDAYVRGLGYRALLVGVYGFSDSPRVYRSAFATDWRLTK
jgi:hypothetical protein